MRLLNLVVDLIEQTVLVIRDIRPRFVVADGDAVVMRLRELSAEADVEDLCAVAAEVGGEVQGQVMDRVEGDHPVKTKLKRR